MMLAVLLPSHTGLRPVAPGLNCSRLACVIMKVNNIYYLNNEKKNPVKIKKYFRVNQHRENSICFDIFIFESFPY